MGGTLDLGSWFILRMASADTLKVVSRLNQAGFSVWTPIDRKVGRMPKTKAEYEKHYALMPSYAFADVKGIDDILSLAMLPDRDMPRFSVFRHGSGIPLIADCQLEDLREIEQRKRSLFERIMRNSKKPRSFQIGQAVRVPDGGFEGLLGEVEGNCGKFTLVRFPGFPQPIKINSFLLLENEVTDLADKRVLRHRNAAKYMGSDVMLENRFSESAKRA